MNFYFFISSFNSVTLPSRRSIIIIIIMAAMGCSTSASASSFCIQRHSPEPPAPHSSYLPEKKFGKVSILNGDGSVIATGTVVPVGERMQLFGRISMNPNLKVKSDEDGNIYEQVDWITKYKGQVKRESVYASDPEAAKAYAENVQKATAAAYAARAPIAPRTPRPMPPPVRRTVFGVPQPPPSMTHENLVPPPFKFDLPPLPLPRLI